MRNLSETLSESQDLEDLLMPAAGYVASAVVLFIIGFCGFFFNLIVLILIWKDKKLWTPLNIILFNLVFSDWLVSILGNPWTFLSALSYKWLFGRTGCILYGFIMAQLGITSIVTLTVLAFERYMLIAKPFQTNAFNNRKAVLLVFVIWLYAFLLVGPPILGWGEYVNEAANISCSINWEEKSFNSTSYILYLFTFGLFVPLLIIVFSYVNIIRTMRQNNTKMGQVMKAERKIACMVFVMIAAFLFAWSPYAILALISQFGDGGFITPAIAVLPALLAKSSICYNPIIYAGLNTQIKQSWKQTVYGEKTASSWNTNLQTRMETESVDDRKRINNILIMTKVKEMTNIVVHYQTDDEVEEIVL